MTSPPRGTAAPPIGLPTFDGPQAWYAGPMADRDDWRHVLSQAEVAELDAAVRAAESARVDLVSMTASDFPLPTLAARLAAIRGIVLHGPGFFLLRGVPVERYTPLQSALAFRGLGAHLGEALPQNGKGHVLGHGWVCNHSILHARTAYEDWPEPDRRRHLLRLWRACDDGPPLPEHLTAGFQGATEGGRPAGIRIPGVPLVAPLEPV